MSVTNYETSSPKPSLLKMESVPTSYLFSILNNQPFRDSFQKQLYLLIAYIDLLYQHRFHLLL
jgi:hypothetical protein